MLAVGIVGLPNVGKSSLFNALSAGQAEVSNYPFTTIDSDGEHLDYCSPSSW